MSQTFSKRNTEKQKMSDWGKTQAEVGISEFKRVVDDASVETVETPAGRKEVEIAYQASYGFEVESGTAVGVYYEPGRLNPETVHIDWADDGNRTTVQFDDIETLDEGEYYTES
jgi:hypothetical protein